jgi:hypothetical protein
MASLEQYVKHLERFGSSCLLESAAHDLTEAELGQLKALIKSMERTQRWHGGRWVHRGQEVRRCSECGLDLPRGASSQMRRHARCKDRAKRLRRAARGGASPTDTPHARRTGRRPPQVDAS